MIDIQSLGHHLDLIYQVGSRCMGMHCLLHSEPGPAAAVPYLEPTSHQFVSAINLGRWPTIEETMQRNVKEDSDTTHRRGTSHS